jgi:hypothetical protein
MTCIAHGDGHGCGRKVEVINIFLQNVLSFLPDKRDREKETER